MHMKSVFLEPRKFDCKSRITCILSEYLHDYTLRQLGRGGGGGEPTCQHCVLPLYRGLLLSFAARYCFHLKAVFSSYLKILKDIMEPFFHILNLNGGKGSLNLQ